ncbi:MAG: ABC transporter ATP-binding protein [Anaerosomatales bacterium]|nr:ABC transporter ATP-binding protein [Anaerosomatales bacterium]
MREYIVETEALAKHYKRAAAVDGIDLAVGRGEIYGFLGLNGAGKTTTIRMLMGLVRPTAGEIRIFGEPMPRRRMAVMGRVGSLVESPSYYAHLSGYDNLRIVSTLLGVDEAEIRRVLGVVGLSPADAERKVGQYSLGMKQRLGIASALIGSPELLVLDEPTNGLDPAGIQEIRELVRRLPREFGITVLVSSHLLAEVDQIATSVGVIHRGRLLFQGPIDDLRAHSAPRVRVEVDRRDDAMAALRAAGIAADTDSEALTLSSVRRDDAAAAVRVLVSERIAIYRVAEERRTLEDIFLELTAEGAVA